MAPIGRLAFYSPLLENRSIKMRIHSYFENGFSTPGEKQLYKNSSGP
jgi:hypothetical protein